MTVSTTASADELALLAAVRAAPADDLPRLVYADWLDERAGPGDARRAEFIRVQCEIHRLDMGERQLPMGVGREQLFAAEERAWCGLLPNFGVPDGWLTGFDYYPPEYNDSGARVRIGRGFVAEVACPADAWLAHGDAVCAAHPVEAVRLTTWPWIMEPRWSGPAAEHRIMARFNDEPHWRESTQLTQARFTEARRRSVRPDTLADIAQAEILGHRWPGIRFELPATARPVGDPLGFAEVQRQRERSILEGLGIPPHLLGSLTPR